MVPPAGEASGDPSGSPFGGAGHAETIATFAHEVSLGPSARLDRLAFLLASRLGGPVDVDAEIRRLDELATAAVDGPGALNTSDLTATDLLANLRAAGFRGNVDDYYDPANSFLDRVLTRRLGIPITLSVVAIEVGRRVGVGLHGVGLPGEFIVAESDAPDRFHNLYRGTSLDEAGVVELVRRFVGPNVEVTPGMLLPVSTLGIVDRMLTNLAHIYAHTEQPAQLAATLELQLLLPGTRVALRRQYGLTLARLGRFWDAAAVFESLHDLHGSGVAGDDPDGGDDGDEMRASDRSIARQLRARLN